MNWRWLRRYTGHRHRRGKLLIADWQKGIAELQEILAMIDACRRDIALNGRTMFVEGVGWVSNPSVSQLIAATVLLRAGKPRRYP
jgi:hypothetical protein